METQVTMSAEERAEFEAFKADKEKKNALQKAKDDREAYKNLVDEQINSAFPLLLEVSKYLSEQKTNAMSAFKGALEMKADIFGIKNEQRSHTFTNSEGTKRIMLGRYVTDGYYQSKRRNFKTNCTKNS